MENEITATFVRDNRTNRIVHHEVFESAKLSPEEFTRALRKREDGLMKQYGVDGFEVFSMTFSSPAGLYDRYPKLKP